MAIKDDDARRQINPKVLRQAIGVSIFAVIFGIVFWSVVIPLITDIHRMLSAVPQ